MQAYANVSKLRLDAQAIFAAGLKAAEPRAAVTAVVDRHQDELVIDGRLYDLGKIQQVFVVGAGKASARMAQALEAMLGDRITAGWVVVKDGHVQPTKKINIVEAGHPVPDARAVSAANRIIQMLRQARRDDLILCLLSGGGSALLSAPADGISLDDKRLATELLLRCGATIQETNAIRKHVSRLKGGNLARIAYPAPIVSLILSDVIGDPLDVIASGPTAPDPTTFVDCLAIVDRYDLREAMPPGLLGRLAAGQRGEIEETPKLEDPLFASVQNVIVGNNQLALVAAQEQAAALGYHTLLLSDPVQGEAAQSALKHAALAERIVRTGAPVARPACVLSGGETTVVVRGDGLGGRNQEFATVAAIAIAGLPNVVILSGGTDGTDGPTDAAGGIVDNTTIERGEAAGFAAKEFLRRNDTYHFLKRVDDLLITGPTFTNVMDVQIMLLA